MGKSDFLAVPLLDFAIDVAAASAGLGFDAAQTLYTATGFPVFKEAPCAAPLTLDAVETLRSI